MHPPERAMSIRPLVGAGEIVEREVVATPMLDMSWLSGAVRFDHRRWRCRETELHWTAPQHLLVLTDGGRTARTVIGSGGRIVYDGADRAGALSFVPAHLERHNIYRGADLSYAALWIDPTLGPAPACGDIGILANARDHVLHALIASLRDDLRAGRPPSCAYVEHMARLVLLRLTAISGRRASARPRHAPLARPVIDRVRDYVDAHIGTDMSLGDMAAVAGIAVDSFSRRFKATTGIAPYAFVLEERLRRAEALLADGRLSIASIALQAGFSSQSHLTSTFSRRRGLTPHAYRSRFLP